MSDDDKKVVNIASARPFAFQRISFTEDQDPVGLSDKGVTVLLYPDRNEGILLSADDASAIGIELIRAAAVWGVSEWEGKDEPPSGDSG